MTRRNNPPRDFDVPKVHLPNPSELNHVLEKSSDPEEIAFRQQNPGLDRLRKQHIGLHMSRRLVFWPFKEKESQAYVNNTVAINLFNTSAFAFEEEQRAGMRNRLKLPILADYADDETWYQTYAGIYRKISEDFNLAEASSINWMNAHSSGYNKRIETSAVTFARSTGQAALKLVSLGLTHDTQSTPSEMGKNVQTLSLQLLDQSREAYAMSGVHPSLKHMATDPVEKVFPAAPTAEAIDALIQLREEYGE